MCGYPGQQSTNVIKEDGSLAPSTKDLLDFIPMKPAPKPQPPAREVKSFPAAAVRLKKLGEPFWPDSET